MSHKLLTALAMAGCGISGAAQAATEIAPNTTVGSQVFLDLTHISNEQNGTDVVPTGTGFDVKRFYLIVDHRFDDVWSANLSAP